MKKLLTIAICLILFSPINAASISPILPNSIVGPLMKEIAISSMPSNSLTSPITIPSSPISAPIGSSLFALFGFLTNAGTIVTSLIPSLP